MSGVYPALAHVQTETRGGLNKLAISDPSNQLSAISRQRSALSEN